MLPSVMGAASTIDPAQVSVQPGGEAASTLTIRNTGTVVDLFTIEVLGDASSWASAEPPTVSLLPEAESNVRIVFKPPRSSAIRAGTKPFAIRISSKEDPSFSAVEEGIVEVGTFSDLFAEILPRTARGRMRARYDLAIDNRGNAPVSASLDANDLNQMLRFDATPPSLSTEPGGAAFAKLRVRPRKVFLKGPARTHPFQVLISTDGAQPLISDGTMLQEGLIPAWVPKALLALGALSVLWLTLLKPVVKSTAEDAVAEPVKSLEAVTQEQGKSISKVAATAPGAKTGGSSGQPAAASQPAAGDPFSGRLALSAKPPEAKASEFKIPAGKAFALTDLVVANPNGGSGVLRLFRNAEALLVLRLENFRDIDYHFVAPLAFKAGDVFRMRLEKCDAGLCDVSALFSGFMRAA